MLEFDAKESLCHVEEHFYVFDEEKLCVANKNLRVFCIWCDGSVLPTCSISMSECVCLCIHSLVLRALCHTMAAILHVKCHSKIIKQVILDEWTEEVNHTRILFQREEFYVKLTTALLDLSRRLQSNGGRLDLNPHKQHKWIFWEWIE